MGASTDRSPIDAYFDRTASPDDVRRAVDALAAMSRGAIIGAQESPSRKTLEKALFGPAAEHWQHIDLAVPLQHPRGGLVERVPILPHRERPRIAMPNPTGDRWFAMFAGLRLGADNEAYVRLASLAARLAWLVALNAPAAIIEEQARRSQEQLDALLALLALPADAPARRALRATEWTTPAGTSRPARLDVPELLDDGDELEDDEMSCAWLDDRRVLVCARDAIIAVDIETGTLSSAWRPPRLPLVGTHGGCALFAESESRWVDDGVLLGVALLDLDAGWRTAIPDDLPLVLVETGDENAWLCNWRTGECAGVDRDEASGWAPHEIARTPDHAFIWVGADATDGAVHETATGLCWLRIGAMQLDRFRERWLDDEPPPEGDRVIAQETRPAIVRANGCWRILDARASVSHDGEQLYRIGRDIRAGAFDRTGDRLAIVDTDSLSIIDVPGARYLKRLSTRGQGL